MTIPDKPGVRTTLQQFVCPDCGGHKSKQATRCHNCRVTHEGNTLRKQIPFDITNVICPNCGGPKSPTAKQCATCRDDARTDDRPFPIGGPERAKHGCIVTFENSEGKTLTLHKTGPVRAVLADLCDDALEHDPTFLVISISTPESVYTDLQGSRSDVSGGGTRFGYPRMPEASHLTGELARMMHPSLARS